MSLARSKADQKGGVVKEILHLTLKKKWFDLIASGKKKYEYREFKPYWERRLLDGSCPGYPRLIVYDEIHFKNGYSKNAPFMRVEHLDSLLGDASMFEVEDIFPNNPNLFQLELGKILEIRNWNES